MQCFLRWLFTGSKPTQKLVLKQPALDLMIAERVRREVDKIIDERSKASEGQQASPSKKMVILRKRVKESSDNSVKVVLSPTPIPAPPKLEVMEQVQLQLVEPQLQPKTTTTLEVVQPNGQSSFVVRNREYSTFPTCSNLCAVTADSCTTGICTCGLGIDKNWNVIPLDVKPLEIVEDSQQQQPQNRPQMTELIKDSQDSDYQDAGKWCLPWTADASTQTEDVIIHEGESTDKEEEKNEVVEEPKELNLESPESAKYPLYDDDIRKIFLAQTPSQTSDYDSVGGNDDDLIKESVQKPIILPIVCYYKIV